VTTPFRQVEAELEESRDDEFLSLGERASLEMESRASPMGRAMRSIGKR
jgi:hypothetical protein